MSVLTWSIDLNKIQNMISNDILPKISEWANITKDYLLDIGSRYINYEIIMSCISSIILFVVLVIWLVLTKRWMDNWKEYRKNPTRTQWLTMDDGWGESKPTQLIMLIIWVIMVIAWMCFIWEIINLIKWLYIPEIPLFKTLVRAKNLI